MSYSIKYVQGVIAVEKVGVGVCAWADPILGIIGIADTALAGVILIANVTINAVNNRMLNLVY